MKSPSLQKNLLVRCGIGVGSLLCLLSVIVYLLFRHSIYKEVESAIEQTAALLSNQLELENGQVSCEWKEGLGNNTALTLESLFQFRDEATGLVTRSPALKSGSLPFFHGPGSAPQIKTIALPDGSAALAIGLQVYPFVLAEEMDRMHASGNVIDPKTHPHTLVVAQSIEPIKLRLSRLRFVLASGLLLTLALGFTLIDHAIRISLRPLNELARQINERSGRQLDDTLSVPGRLPSELVGVARDFSSLLSRVAESRNRERDFIRHAAHELRTPIAGLQAVTELSLSKPREAEEYANFLKTCLKSAKSLGELVRRLSELARIGGKTASPAELKPLLLCEVLENSLADFRPIFTTRNLKLSFEPCDKNLSILGDLALIRIILSNLFDNAASYTPEGGEISITLTKSNEKILLSISNPATDLPENLDCLFEPLFRREHLDTPRTHLGIGLTLSLEAAEAMAATLHAQKTENSCIKFTLSFLYACYTKFVNFQNGRADRLDPPKISLKD